MASFTIGIYLSDPEYETYSKDKTRFNKIAVTALKDSVKEFMG